MRLTHCYGDVKASRRTCACHRSFLLTCDYRILVNRLHFNDVCRKHDFSEPSRNQSEGTRLVLVSTLDEEVTSFIASSRTEDVKQQSNWSQQFVFGDSFSVPKTGSKTPWFLGYEFDSLFSNRVLEVTKKIEALLLSSFPGIWLLHFRSKQCVVIFFFEKTPEKYIVF